ncbi:unnamed protein product [Schistosoma margrebowiei]|uniref:Uncharacterized protein n=1 Tax=Schistosoma margrebowiei TaxID=48269 RepID=A0A183LXF6_9TREM|nr:unnamed protein product [Schistosoma margrebowiei]
MPRLKWTTLDMKASWDDTKWEEGTKMVKDLQTYMPSINWSWAALYSHTKLHEPLRITIHRTKSTIFASTKSSGGQWMIREPREEQVYSIRSSLAGRQDEIETQEVLDNGADNITKVQYGLSSGY